MRVASALAVLLLVASAASADGVETLADSLRVAEPSLARRLAEQLAHLRAADARRARDREMDRLREEGRLSYIGTPEELELHRLRERAALRRDRDVEELELPRLASAAGRGARAELEAVRHRLDLARAIDRVLEQAELRRRVYHLDRRLAHRRAAEVRLQRPGALRSERWRSGQRAHGSPGLDVVHQEVVHPGLPLRQRG